MENILKARCFSTLIVPVADFPQSNVLVFFVVVVVVESHTAALSHRPELHALQRTNEPD